MTAAGIRVTWLEQSIAPFPATSRCVLLSAGYAESLLGRTQRPLTPWVEGGVLYAKPVRIGFQYGSAWVCLAVEKAREL